MTPTLVLLFLMATAYPMSNHMTITAVGAPMDISSCRAMAKTLSNESPIDKAVCMDRAGNVHARFVHGKDKSEIIYR